MKEPQIPAERWIKNLLWACSFRSAGNILIDSLATGRLERIHLQVEILIPRTYARVADFHDKVSHSRRDLTISTFDSSLQ
jgi:hypothetical protein